MMKLKSEEIIKKCILEHLSKKGWDYNVKTKNLHEHGCDIIVTENKNKARRFYIECKEKSYAKSAKAVNEANWLNALGQLITRMSVKATHAYKYGLGLPEASAQKALQRIPWQAARHLCLYIFSVDDKGNVTEYSPKDFKKFNKKSKN